MRLIYLKQPVLSRIGMVLVLLLISWRSFAGTTNNHHTTKEEEMADIQKNKQTIRKLYEESLNKRNLLLLKELVAEDYMNANGKQGVAAFEQNINELIRAFPDVQWKLEEFIAEGDKVIVRQQMQGTHLGQFQHIAATGKRITSDGIGIYEFKAGKIIRSQVHTDRIRFLQQLEILPADLALLKPKISTKEQVYFIDKFLVPPSGKEEFYERMQINRSFIRKLPGFIEDAAYEYTDDKGNLICITIASWKSQEALNQAKVAVQAEYKKQGFDVGEMMRRLNIEVERGVYSQVEDRH